MAVSTLANGVPPPSTANLLTPLLPALTTAAVSKSPASNVLPLLSPILRQRVQFLSATSPDPWLHLLCYDRVKATALQEIATNGALEPHPVSGEVEVDWDYDVETRYKRLDEETLQALIALKELGIGFQLVWCVGDKEGGGDGWRVGEVTAVDKSNLFSTFEGFPSLAEADKNFQENKVKKPIPQTNGFLSAGPTTQVAQEEEDEDDGYWDRYDATPSRTPAQKPSPAPGAMSSNRTTSAAKNNDDDEAYFAQYDSVQPAMDNHDPDEEEAAAQLTPPLGMNSPPTNSHLYSETLQPESAYDHAILHPRPESSASSKGSDMVAKLEEEAGKQNQSEFGVKQHVSRSIRSLFMLSRASGIEREEFERIVKTELDMLGMMGDEE